MVKKVTSESDVDLFGPQSKGKGQDKLTDDITQLGSNIPTGSGTTLVATADRILSSGMEKLSLSEPPKRLSERVLRVEAPFAYGTVDSFTGLTLKETLVGSMGALRGAAWTLEKVNQGFGYVIGHACNSSSLSKGFCNSVGNGFNGAVRWTVDHTPAGVKQWGIEVAQDYREGAKKRADEYFVNYGIPKETTLQAAKDLVFVPSQLALYAAGYGVGKVAFEGLFFVGGIAKKGFSAWDKMALAQVGDVNAAAGSSLAGVLSNSGSFIPEVATERVVTTMGQTMTQRTMYPLSLDKLKAAVAMENPSAFGLVHENPQMLNQLAVETIVHNNGHSIFQSVTDNFRWNLYTEGQKAVWSNEVTMLHILPTLDVKDFTIPKIIGYTMVPTESGYVYEIATTAVGGSPLSDLIQIASLNPQRTLEASLAVNHLAKAYKGLQAVDQGRSLGFDQVTLLTAGVDISSIPFSKIEIVESFVSYARDNPIPAKYVFGRKSLNDFHYRGVNHEIGVTNVGSMIDYMNTYGFAEGFSALDYEIGLKLIKEATKHDQKLQEALVKSWKSGYNSTSFPEPVRKFAELLVELDLH